MRLGRLIADTGGAAPPRLRRVPRRTGRFRRWAPDALAALFATSGVVHLVSPQTFLSMMPRVLPAESHLALVYASGVVELACAAGLVMRLPWSGVASAALLVAVLPSNVQAALDATYADGWGSPASIVLWLRLPLQVPLVWAALQARPQAVSRAT